MPLVVMVLKTGTVYAFVILSRPHDPTRIKVCLPQYVLVTRLVNVCKRCLQATRPMNAAGVCCVSHVDAPPLNC